MRPFQTCDLFCRIGGADVAIGIQILTKLLPLARSATALELGLHPRASRKGAFPSPSPFVVSSLPGCGQWPRNQGGQVRMRRNRYSTFRKGPGICSWNTSFSHYRLLRLRRHLVGLVSGNRDFPWLSRVNELTVTSLLVPYDPTVPSQHFQHVSNLYNPRP